MPEDALSNGGALTGVVSDGGVGEVDVVAGPRGRVLGMQAKLHRWAAADPGRRFDDLFNLVCDPATPRVAFERVTGNRGREPRASTVSPSSTSSGNSASRASWTTCATR